MSYTLIPNIRDVALLSKNFNPDNFKFKSTSMTLEELQNFFIRKIGADIVNSFLLFTNRQTFLEPIVLDENAKIHFNNYEITNEGINGLNYENLPKLNITDELQPQLTAFNNNITSTQEHTEYIYCLLSELKAESLFLKKKVAILEMKEKQNETTRNIVANMGKTIWDLLRTVSTLIISNSK